MKRFRDFAIVAGLVLLALALHRKILRLWWNYDDFYLLHLAFDHSLADSFFSGSVWPQKLFTPMVMAVYEGNIAAFGLDTSRWFAIHLFFLVVATLAFYAALRTWLDELPSAAGAILFVASVPLVSLTTELSGIHYLFSVLFGSLTTIAYVRALRRDRFVLTLVSAFIYLVAMLAKETVAPLLLILVLLPERDARTRIRYAVPHAFALAIYLVWRRAVIGTFLGGYGWAVERGEWPMLIATLPQKIILACAGANVPLGVALIVLMTIGVVFAIRRQWLLFLVALALAAGPILPVSTEMQRRYALMPWLCWSIAFVAGAEVLRRRNRAVGVALLTIVPLLAIVVNRQEWGHEFGKMQRMSDESRFFFDMPPDSYLRAPLLPPAAMGELNWLKTQHEHKPAGAAWFYDDYFLCTTPVSNKRAWEYASDRRMMVEITSSLPQVAQRFCGSIRNDAPLSADFDYRAGSLFWTFGPYTDGRWRVLLGNGVQAFDVPREEGFQLPDIPGISLRIRYDSPQGWTTYSPELALDFVQKPKMSWRR